MEENNATEANADCFDFISRLSGTGRDFLVRNTGEKVKINTLEGKKLGLYFSGSWCRPCQQFTPNLVEVYNELSSIRDFEIILVSADIYIEAFDRYFAKMPWLAIPFSDSVCLKNLQELFAVIDKGIPYLVILDEKGKVLTDKGVEIILDFGAEGYPFTLERIKEMKEKEEEAKKNQSLKYLLVTPSRDFVISNDEKKVPVSELEGKMVGLYFFYPSNRLCSKFTPKLMEVYNKVKDIGERFEIVMLCVDDDDELFRESLRSTPWFAVPFTDSRWQKLVRYFELQSVPSLVIIKPDGKTLSSNAVEAIEDYGIRAYPFTPEKLAELAEIEKVEVQKAGWPQKVKHALHNEHELVLTWRRSFICAKCKEEGSKWSFRCEECDLDLHPKCALKDDNGTPMDTQQEKEFGEETEEEEEEPATEEQSLRSILVSPLRDFVLTNNENKVPVADLEGKMVGLYFYHPSHDPCLEFNPKLVQVYNKLKEMGERFEIVMVCLEDKDKESFNLSLRTMPWFALPFNDNSLLKLVLQFHIKSLPTLVIIGPDGKTLHSNVAEFIQEYGIQAYPFTPEKFAEFEEIEKAKNAAQTLESILVSENRDFVIAKDGTKVPVSDLVGKNIFLYFSAHWCPGCRDFLPKIIEAYQEIKAKDNLFEVIFISYDRDKASFQAFFSRMSWLAIPFGDKRREFLTRKFKVSGIPTVVAIGRTGKTVTTEVTDLIEDYGGHAYSLIFQDENKDEEDVEKSVQKDEKELEKKVNEDEKRHEKRAKKDKENVNKDSKKREMNVNEDKEEEGTVMNTLLRKFLSLIQAIFEFFQKLGFLS
ncbi:putative nucleoredoxin 1 [Camellia lanceoleosa]|uniref:Nucleoredoxin 1 n=1 Tax=Camellia lanceoleosa TaxID=1840588 RepID=A0ACC0J2D6_9ERIC|nr:putative nucleoredoxin 1 [Camellia lanceoleosa]